MVEIIHCDRKFVTGIDRRRIFQRSRDSPGPAVRNMTGGIQSGPDIYHGLQYFIAVWMAEKSNEMRDYLNEVGMGWVWECRRFSVVRIKEKNLPDTLEMFTRDCLLRALNGRKLGMTHKLGCVRTLKKRQVFRTG